MGGRRKPERARHGDVARALCFVAMAIGCAGARSGTRSGTRASGEPAPRATPDTAPIRQLSAESRPYRMGRGLWGDPRIGDTIFVEQGDTLPLVLYEIRCVYDMCGTKHDIVADSGWTVEDARLATLDARPSGDTAWLVARAPGRTRVRVAGLRGPQDSLPIALRRGPKDSAVVPAIRGHSDSVVIAVIPAIRAVEWGRLPDSVSAGEAVVAEPRVVSVAGDTLLDVPLWIQSSPARAYVMRRALSGRRAPLFTLRGASVGPDTVVVLFGRHADTAVIVLRPPR